MKLVPFFVLISLATDKNWLDRHRLKTLDSKNRFSSNSIEKLFGEILETLVFVGLKSTSNRRRWSVKNKGVLKNVAKFTRKRLGRSLSYNKVGGLKLC